MVLENNKCSDKERTELKNYLKKFFLNNPEAFVDDTPVVRVTYLKTNYKEVSCLNSLLMELEEQDFIFDSSHLFPCDTMTYYSPTDKLINLIDG